MHTHRLLVALLCLSPLTAQNDTAKKVDFATQILPVLQKRCVECHGPDEQEADLRLDSRAGLYPKDKTLWTVIPGKPKESLLYERIILPADDDEIMPADGDPLSKAEIALIRQWIAEGGEWPAGVGAKVHKAPPKEQPLPLPAMGAAALEAQTAAMAKVRQMGGLAMTLAQGSKATEVNFSLLGKKVGDAALAQLQAMAPSLVRLNLARTGVGDAGMQQVAQLAQLRWLNLSGTGVGDAGLRKLAGLHHLTYLNLYGSKVGDASIDLLAKLPALKKVFVWQTGVSAAGAARLRKARPGLMVDRGEAAVALSKVVTGPQPINKTCPVSGKPVAPNKTVVHEGQAIGLCCGKCVKAFQKVPQKYLGKVKGFIATSSAQAQNAFCPLNGKKKVSPKQTLAHKGVRVGFCCAKCKGRFAKNPGSFEKPLAKLIGAAAKTAKKK